MTKILMADDESDALEIMAKKAASAGYDVVTASDGQVAWEKIVAEQPDVVLLDLTMPGMHGFEVLKKLRKTPPFKKWCPVIIVSAHDELSSFKKGFALEAEHYLTKPCSSQEILKAIELVLSFSTQRKVEKIKE